MEVSEKNAMKTDDRNHPNSSRQTENEGRTKNMRAALLRSSATMQHTMQPYRKN
jgi:hypothetical protein